MRGSLTPPSVFMVEKATAGLSRTSLSVSTKAVEQAELLPAIPREAGALDWCRARRAERGAGRGESVGGGRRGARACGGELGKLPQRQPGAHAFAPAQIGRDKARCFQTFPDFVLGKNPEGGSAATNVDIGHASGFIEPASRRQSHSKVFRLTSRFHARNEARYFRVNRRNERKSISCREPSSKARSAPISPITGANLKP